MSMLDNALFYAKKGWYVFPLKTREKIPVVLWRDVATLEENTIRGWFEKEPDANIGIMTGSKSDIFVLDIDAGHGGEESLSELTAQFGELPKTPIVHTGGGGRHIFFKYHSGTKNTAGKIGKGIDTRSEGGYVVAGGSIHPNGTRYTWDKECAPSKTPVADAPEWLINLLLVQQTTSQPVQSNSDNSAIPNGGRNNALTSLAGTLRRKGMSEKAILEALLIHNREKCIPPLAESEVKVIASSMGRYTPDTTFEQNRDRLQTEWSFAKAIFEYPNTASDFLEVLPDMFADHTLSDFWRHVANNEDVTDAAVKSGILTELERYKDFDIARLDGYARSIIRFSYLATVAKKAKSLEYQANNANDAGIDKAITEIIKIPSLTSSRAVTISDVADELESRIIERSLNPVDVWGIPYAWEKISLVTGGKQKGELTLVAGEPGTGKSWFELQDALYTAIGGVRQMGGKVITYPETPIFYWCGEMKRYQIMMRFYQLLGVSGRAMKSGYMSNSDWELLNDAKALILNSALYIDDQPLQLHEVRPLLVKQKQEHGIEQAIFDYAKLIQAPGRDEIEQTQNVSVELKRLASDLQLAITVIVSVNKGGMDSKTDGVSMSILRGGGQQLHDADNIFIMTKFDGANYGMDYGVSPTEYDRVRSLHFSKGRELEHIIENGFIPYMRENGTPKFKELKKTV